MDDIGSPGRSLRRGALLGGGLWVACAGYCAITACEDRLELIELLLLFGPLLAVPGGLSMVVGQQAPGELRGEGPVVRFLLPAALCVVVSRWLAPGFPAAALAAPWLLVTGLVALLGLQRIIRRGFFPLAELTVDAGLLYLPVGGGWLLLSSAGLEPMGFDSTIVLLTAVHFHFAGFSAALVAGLTGRVLKGDASVTDNVRSFALGAYRLAAAIVILGPPLVAVGIMASPIVEVISGVALSIGMLTLAFVLVLIALAVERFLPKLLLCIAALSLTATMALSMTYAAGEYRGEELVSIATMAATHGVANVLGFTFCGGLGLIVLLRETGDFRADG